MVIYGTIICLIFLVPCGIVMAMTGIQIMLNTLAEFIGGALVPGNALAMNFIKIYA